MSDLLAGVLAAAVLYWLPGWLFLRRSGLDSLTRGVAAVAVSYPATTLLAEALGAIGGLNRPLLLAGTAGLAVLAWRCPLAAGSFATRAGGGLILPVVAALGFGTVVLVQGIRPDIIRVFDGAAFWAPLASDIASNGDLTPGWVQTVLQGFPPSVALIAGSLSIVAGGFADAHAMIVHPIFTALFLVTVVLLGAWFEGRRGAWIALLIVVATPLLGRGVLFHDDLAAAFLSVAAVLLAMRAGSWPGWVVVGMVAGGAVALKHLGIVVVLLVVAVLLGRRAAAANWVAAAAGTLVGIPWYLANVVRFGNPVYPLLPELFGEGPDVVRIVTDQATNLQAADRGSFVEIGLLSLVVVVTGLLAALLRVARDDEAEERHVVVTLVSASVVYLAVWATSGYATRHVLIVLGVLAAIAGWGLGALEPLRSQGRSRVGRVPIAILLGLLVMAGWNVRDGFYRGVEPGPGARTGIFTVLEGKYRDLRLLAEPPADPMTLFGQINDVWEMLATLDPEGVVLAFDQRRFYIPQRILGGNDLGALPIYDAGDAEARHRAMLDAGVRYVLDTPPFAARHPFYAMPPWTELAARPDLYRPLLATRRVLLYEVLGASDG